ncbi:MAG: hypothetical protein JWM12_928 [Ilumatobacteraceae bacterium]|nr:hypothetical protein [Ilumatobacteraceae bacterium]
MTGPGIRTGGSIVSVSEGWSGQLQSGTHFDAFLDVAYGETSGNAFVVIQRSDVPFEESVLAPQQDAMRFMRLSAQLSYTDVQ